MSKRRRLLRAGLNPDTMTIRQRQLDNLKLRQIKPLTINQDKTFKAYSEGKHLLLTGSAGTGKSFLSLYLMLCELVAYDSCYRKLIIIRSASPVKDIGFLPGSQKEKTEVYEAPYIQIVNDLFERGDAWDILKKKGLIEFESTSFLRGLTFNDSLIFVDEMQNNSFQENDSVITRLGDNSRIIFSGDIKQKDFQKHQDPVLDSFNSFKLILNNLSEFNHIDFETKDIVRSGLVKHYLIAKEQLF